ncbi:MAG: serine/threonine protein kinase [Cytophagales bacterium]|nr:MAG: serine/threonine protein kinase [Cytophagales bacterium]
MPTVNFNTHLPGYEVLAELGRGNTRVLKARHQETNNLVAIKQYAFAADADLLRRFERESEIMLQIDHPNVVKVREVQLKAAMPYVVMDFVEGGDLRGLLRKEGHLPIPTVIRLGLQLTEAFRAVHPLKVVHRDIKPENILHRPLASGELHVLLTDFGIAKFWSEDASRTRTGQSMMTCEYAAPEQFDTPRQVDQSADYYALGVVLYECLTGGVPFVLDADMGLAQYMQQVLTAPVPAPVLPSGENLPPSLETLLMRLLTKDARNRLHHPDELELLLEQSRVEYLRAKRTGVAPVAVNQTLAQPVRATVATQAVTTEYDEPLQELEEASESRWGWLGIGGIILAIALAVGLYVRSNTAPASTLISPTDSSFVAPVDSSAMDTDFASAEADTVQETQETDNEESVVIESLVAPSVDTTTRNVALPDSVAVPSDSTDG